MAATMPPRTHLKGSGSVSGMLSGTFSRYPSATSGRPTPRPPLNTPTPTPFSLGLRVCGNTNQVIMASSLILVGKLKQFSAGEN